MTLFRRKWSAHNWENDSNGPEPSKETSCRLLSSFQTLKSSFPQTRNSCSQRLVVFASDFLHNSGCKVTYIWGGRRGAEGETKSLPCRDMESFLECHGSDVSGDVDALPRSRPTEINSGQEIEGLLFWVQAGGTRCGGSFLVKKASPCSG